MLRPRVFNKVVEEAVKGYEPSAPSDNYRDEMPVMGSVQDAPVETTVTISLSVSQALFDEYKRVAAAQDMTVEEVMQHRLKTCKTHNATRGLWFSGTELNSLENLLKKWPLESTRQAIDLISKAGSVSFDEIKVTLTPAQKRVLALCGRAPQTVFESMVKREFRV